MNVIDRRIGVNLTKALKNDAGENYRAYARWHQLLCELSRKSAMMTKDLSSDCVWLLENLMWNNQNTSVEELVNYLEIIYDTLSTLGTSYPDQIKIRHLGHVVGPRNPEYKTLCSGFKLYPDLTYANAIASISDAEGDVIKTMEHKQPLFREEQSNLQRNLARPPSYREMVNTAKSQEAHFAKVNAKSQEAHFAMQNATLRGMTELFQAHQARDDKIGGGKSGKQPTTQQKGDRNEGPCAHSFANGSVCGMPHATIFHNNAFKQMSMDPALQPGHSAKGQRSFQDTYRKEVKPRGNQAVSKHTRFQTLQDDSSDDNDLGNMARAHMSTDDGHLPDLMSTGEEDEYEQVMRAMDAMRASTQPPTPTSTIDARAQSRQSSASMIRPIGVSGVKSEERLEDERILREFASTDLSHHMRETGSSPSNPSTPTPSGTFGDEHLYSAEQLNRSDAHRQQALGLRDMTARNKRLDEELAAATVRRESDRQDQEHSMFQLLESNERVQRSNILLSKRVHMMESAQADLIDRLDRVEARVRTMDDDARAAYRDTETLINDQNESIQELDDMVATIRGRSAEMMTSLNDISIRVDARNASTPPTRNPHHTRSRGLVPSEPAEGPRAVGDVLPAQRLFDPRRSTSQGDTMMRSPPAQESFEPNPTRELGIVSSTITTTIDATAPTLIDADSNATDSPPDLEDARGGFNTLRTVFITRLNAMGRHGQ